MLLAARRVSAFRRRALFRQTRSAGTVALPGFLRFCECFWMVHDFTECFFDFARSDVTVMCSRKAMERDGTGGKGETRSMHLLLVISGDPCV